jgi:triacylglycerol lipase
VIGVFIVCALASTGPVATPTPPPTTTTAPTTTNTPSPVLLVPGFMGWRNIDSVGAYFHGLKEALTEAGADVYAIGPPPIATSEVRGRFLMRAIDDVLARTHAQKVAIIAHSQGGLDVRVALAHGYASKIAVVATLSSPHHGTDLADAAAAWLPADVVKLALDRVQSTWEYEQHVPHRDADAAGAIATLSRAGSAKFNADNSDTGGVPFFSLASVTGADVDGSCKTGGRWGAPKKIDALHPLFEAAHLMIRMKGGEESDDGVVPTGSMRFGTYLGCIAGDHADWMGWTFDRDGGDYVETDAGAFLVELWKGMRDVELAHDPRAMDAHVQALAKLANADVIDDTSFFATR